MKGKYRLLSKLKIKANGLPSFPIVKWAPTNGSVQNGAVPVPGFRNQSCGCTPQRPNVLPVE